MAVSRITTTVPAGSGTARVFSERQSISTAWPSSPAAEIIWSMIPQFTPTQRFSARWARRAIAPASQSIPETAAKARAVASSSAALEERPAPMGTSLAITPSHPPSACPACASAHAVALRYSLHAGPPRASGSSANSAVSPKSREWTETRPSVRGRSAIQTARSMAMGSTKPSL